MKALDRWAIKEIGIPEILLMEHAAMAVATTLKNRFKKALNQSKGLILCGPGNNGADAMAAARLIHQWNLCRFRLVLLNTHGNYSPLNLIQSQILKGLDIPIHEDFSKKDTEGLDWIIDGLFGTGFKGELDGRAKDWIERLDNSFNRSWVIAIDIPSGLNSDTGVARGTCVRANQTVALGALKRGLVTGSAADYVGKVGLASIQIPRNHPFQDTGTQAYDLKDAKKDLPGRRPTSHKGDFGHVFVWAGPRDKEGAAIIAATAAMKSGAGRTTLVAPKNQLESLLPRCPAELMTLDSHKPQPNETWVVGPGMGLDENAWQSLETFLSSQSNLVLDADALTLMGENRSQSILLMRSRVQKKLETILTPHPKEAARLLGKKYNVETIEMDRYLAVELLSQTYGSTVLLKGRGTLIHDSEQATIVSLRGDQGLAKGGSGDALSGLIAGLMAQGVSCEVAGRLGAWIHGFASEKLTEKKGQSYTSLASEIISYFQEAFRHLMPA